MAEVAIQSKDNAVLRRFSRMNRDPKARHESGLLPLEGPRLAREALSIGAAREALFSQAWAAGDEGQKLALDLRAAGCKVSVAADRLFKQIADTQSPQGVSLLCAMPAAAGEAELKQASFLLALDGVQDPGNLGTLLRSAWACSCDAVLLGEGCADPYGPKATRASAGAALRLKLAQGVNLAALLRMLGSQGMATLALDVRGLKTLWQAELKGRLCLVVGSEGQGLQADTLAACVSSLRLDYPGQAESLNAAVSGSLALFEALRQRKSN